MTRALSGTDAAQVASTVVGVVQFLAIAIPSGTLYLNSTDRSYTWGGNTYSPTNGQWGVVGNYNETADTVPRPMSLQLSGVDQTLINNLTGNAIQWSQITYSIGFTDATGALLDNPSFSAPMFLGDCSIVLNEKTGVINISAENLTADLQKRFSGMLQTSGDQQARFAGDTAFDNVASLINQLIWWGQYGPMQVGLTAGGKGNNGNNGTGIWLNFSPGADPTVG